MKIAVLLFAVLVTAYVSDAKGYACLFDDDCRDPCISTNLKLTKTLCVAGICYCSNSGRQK